MRVYFERAAHDRRLEGFINDPQLDGSFQINDGLRTGRRPAVELNEMGMPAGVEYLDVISPQYISDLVKLGGYRSAHH
jgi:3-deoxy-7-phosphoheptulonate synthase